MSGRIRVWLVAGAVAAWGTGGGCDHVVYVSETNLGISVNAASQGTPKIALGYDRETFAVVPRYAGNGSGPEAMSLLSLSNVDVTGLDELIFNHYIVTGAAAKEAAKDPTGLAQMRKAMFGETGK